MPAESVRVKISSDLNPAIRFAVGVDPNSSWTTFQRSYRNEVDVTLMILPIRRRSPSYWKLAVLPPEMADS